MGLLHMDALVFGALPALDKQQLVLILGREVVIIGQAAVLLANKGQDALLHQLADKFLPAAELGLVADIQHEFFHRAPPVFFCYCSTSGGQVQIFLRRSAKKHLQAV